MWNGGATETNSVPVLLHRTNIILWLDNQKSSKWNGLFCQLLPPRLPQTMVSFHSCVIIIILISVFTETSGELRENHQVGQDLTFWKRYELSVDLNIAPSVHGDWSNVFQFRDPNSNWATFAELPVGDRLPAIFQLANSNHLHLCNYINGEVNHCYDQAMPENTWFNLKFVQVRVSDTIFSLRKVLLY